MPAAVASRYARALVELATRPGAGVDPYTILSQFDAFEGALAASAGLRQLLLSPAIPAAEKRGLVTRLAEHLGLSDLVRRFLCVIIDHRRTNILSDIRDSFESLMDERLGVVRVGVTSAHELSPSQREALAAGLSRLTGKKARPAFSVDPELIGGVVAQIGSTIYDGSVRGRLNALKQKLAGAES